MNETECASLSLLYTEFVPSVAAIERHLITRTKMTSVCAALHCRPSAIGGQHLRRTALRPSSQSATATDGGHLIVAISRRMIRMQWQQLSARTLCWQPSSPLMALLSLHLLVIIIIFTLPPLLFLELEKKKKKKSLKESSAMKQNCISSEVNTSNVPTKALQHK